MKELLCEKKYGAVMLPWWLSGPDGKELPAVQETWVPSLGWKDSLEKGRLPASVFLWRIPQTEGPSRLQSMELRRVTHA